MMRSTAEQVKDQEEEARHNAAEIDRDHAKLGNTEILGPAPAGNELVESLESEAYTNLTDAEKLEAWKLYWDADEEDPGDECYMQLEEAARHIANLNQLKLEGM